MEELVRNGIPFSRAPGVNREAADPSQPALVSPREEQEVFPNNSHSRSPYNEPYNEPYNDPLDSLDTLPFEPLPQEEPDPSLPYFYHDWESQVSQEGNFDVNNIPEEELFNHLQASLSNPSSNTLHPPTLDPTVSVIQPSCSVPVAHDLVLPSPTSVQGHSSTDPAERPSGSGLIHEEEYTDNSMSEEALPQTPADTDSQIPLSSSLALTVHPGDFQNSNNLMEQWWVPPPNFRLSTTENMTFEGHIISPREIMVCSIDDKKVYRPLSWEGTGLHLLFSYSKEFQKIIPPKPKKISIFDALKPVISEGGLGDQLGWSVGKEGSISCIISSESRAIIENSNEQNKALLKENNLHMTLTGEGDVFSANLWDCLNAKQLEPSSSRLGGPLVKALKEFSTLDTLKDVALRLELKRELSIKEVAELLQRLSNVEKTKKLTSVQELKFHLALTNRVSQVLTRLLTPVVRSAANNLKEHRSQMVQKATAPLVFEPVKELLLQASPLHDQVWSKETRDKAETMARQAISDQVFNPLKDVKGLPRPSYYNYHSSRGSRGGTSRYFAPRPQAPYARPQPRAQDPPLRSFFPYQPRVHTRGGSNVPKPSSQPPFRGASKRPTHLSGQRGQKPYTRPSTSFSSNKTRGGSGQSSYQPRKITFPTAKGPSDPRQTAQRENSKKVTGSQSSRP